MDAQAQQLDVCIVSWRTRDLLRACLRSLVGGGAVGGGHADAYPPYNGRSVAGVGTPALQTGRPEVAQVVVVDNASGDGTPDMVRTEFPSVHLLAKAENVGFAAGNNQAIRAGTAPFVLLLNPDTEVREGALSALLEAFAEDARIGAVAAQLVLPGGSVQRSCRSFPEPAAVLFDALRLSKLFPQSEVFGRYRMTYWDHASRRDCDQPMASALALRRAALEEVGLFDEQFPLYFNDVDLCYRLRQAGWRIVFEPKAKVLHHHGGSTGQVRPSAIVESHRSLIRFYRKHYRGRTGWLGYWLVIIGARLTMHPRAALARLFERAGEASPQGPPPPPP